MARDEREKENKKDCHYCAEAMCLDDKDEVTCCIEDGYIVKDSIKEAQECCAFQFCDVFPKF